MSLYAITLIGLPSLEHWGAGQSPRRWRHPRCPARRSDRRILAGLLVILFAPFFWKRSIDTANRR